MYSLGVVVKRNEWRWKRVMHVLEERKVSTIEVWLQSCLDGTKVQRPGSDERSLRTFAEWKRQVIWLTWRKIHATRRVSPAHPKGNLKEERAVPRDEL